MIEYKEVGPEREKAYRRIMFYPGILAEKQYPREVLFQGELYKVDDNIYFEIEPQYYIQERRVWALTEDTWKYARNEFYWTFNDAKK